MAGIEKDQDGLLTRVIHYTVTETAVMDHVISDTRTHTVTVTLQDDLYGNMYAFVTYSDGDQVELNNKYTADCRIAPAVTKVLTGRAWQATDSFEFKLSPITDNAPLPAAGTETVRVTAADKTFEFGLITFTEPGTYEYEISEVTPDAQKLPGVTNDSSKHRVTITVREDPLSSELNATLKYDYAAADCLTVTNAYHSKGQFSLQAVKEIAGSNKPGFTSMFTFQLFNEQGVKIDEKKLSFNANETSWSKTVTFDPISVSEEDIFLTSGSDTAEFVYTVKEYIPEGAKPNEPRGSYIYDFTEYTVHVLLKDNGDGTITATQTESPADVKFVNIYGAMGSIRLEARKVLNGETLREGEFTFLLKDQNGTELQRKTNSADGKIVFDPIAYTEADLGPDGKATLNYTISELEGSNSKFTYDSSVCNVVVSLQATQDDSIIATATYDNASAFRTFTNKAGASGKVHLGATKKLSGEKLKAGSFSFQLKDSTGKILQTKKNDSAGNVTFDEITYTLDDVAKSPIRYTISEQEGSSGKYIYDANVYDVLVTLTDNNDGTITATPDKKSIEISFTNTARAIGSVSLKASKVLKGSTLQNGEFTFILKDSAGNILQKKTNDSSGNIAFDPISYTLADLPNSPIRYTISEEKGSEEGILYDEDVITVKVTLTDNGDGTITATPDLTGKDLQFVNWAWHSPLTGDKEDPVFLFMLFTLSGSFLVCAVSHRKKRKGRL